MLHLEGKIYPTECRIPENSKERQRKTVEWERLEIPSRKSKVSRGVHAKMGIIKDRNSKDITDAEEIKKRW